jgi:hypothetical protein
MELGNALVRLLERADDVRLTGGALVLDGAVWPPNELGLLRSPISMQVEKGVVTSIDGDAAARTFRGWIEGHADPNMFRVAHWSLGFNPGVAQPTGRIVEEHAPAVFVGGGNSFRLLNALCERQLITPLRERVLGGAPYLATGTRPRREPMVTAVRLCWQNICDPVRRLHRLCQTAFQSWRVSRH